MTGVQKLRGRLWYEYNGQQYYVCKDYIFPTNCREIDLHRIIQASLLEEVSQPNIHNIRFSIGKASNYR